jgi:hypothetical protein
MSFFFTSPLPPFTVSALPASQPSSFVAINYRLSAYIQAGFYAFALTAMQPLACAYTRNHSLGKGKSRSHDLDVGTYLDGLIYIYMDVPYYTYNR